MPLWKTLRSIIHAGAWHNGCTNICCGAPAAMASFRLARKFFSESEV
jgi:hypothetical protein